MKKVAALFIVFVLMTANINAQAVRSTTTQNTHVFIENKGQWPDEVMFLTRLGGLDAWITTEGITYDFYQVKSEFSVDETHNQSRSGQVVKTKYKSCNLSVTGQGLIQQAGYYNYFIGNDPRYWAAEVRLFDEVLVENIYDRIDVRYYFDAGKLRYDFIVHPGANVSDIQLQVTGASELFLNKSGELITSTRFGPFSQGNLFTYQEAESAKTEVKSSFDVAGNLVTFLIANYDHTKDLIIDPIVWSTFIGGSGTDQMQGIDLDASGNVCMAGLTNSANYPTTVGAYDLTFNSGTYDVVASKLNATGNSLLWSTFIGGAAQDQANALQVDANGDFYIGGQTLSSDYPTTAGAVDQTFNTLNDVFVTKLNSTGTLLSYSTFLGGSGHDYCYGIAVDASGAAFVTGMAGSNDYPTVAGSYDVLHNGGVNDIFISKINPAGSALVYSTFVGAAGGETGYAIAIDNAGCAYVTGYTTSVVFPTTAGVYGPSLIGGASDGFIVKLNAAGSALSYSSYIGGSSDDRLYGITVNGISGEAIITGYAYSGTTQYPTTAGSYDQTYNGGTCDIVVTKFNANCTALLFSTYIGGSGNDFATSISTDANGNILISGYLTSTNYPTTAGSQDQTYNGGTYDVPLTVLSSTGSALVYSTYLGGAADEYGTAVVFGPGGGAFVTGSTGSSAYPTTAGAYDISFNGGVDVFVTKVVTCTAPVVSVSSNSPVCTGQTINLTSGGGTSYSWTGPNSFTSTAQNPTISGATIANSGTYIVTVTNASGCINTGSVSVNVGPVVTIASNSPVCAGQNLNLTSGGGTTYAWAGPNSFTSPLQNPTITGIAAAGAGVYTVTVTDANSCVGSATISVVVNASPNATATSNSPICAGQSILLSSGTVAGATYSWSGPSSFTSALQSPTIPAATIANAGVYSVTVTNSNGCSASATVNVVVNAVPTATASTNSPLCTGATLNLSSGSVAGATYTWSGPNSFSSALQNPSIIGVSAANAGTYSVTVTNASGCSSTATVSVVVNALPNATASGNGPLCEGQTLNLVSAGGINYSWSGPNSFSSNLQNPSLANTTIANSGTYVVTVTNANSCSATASVVVTINATPAASASTNGPVCSGATLNLSSGSVAGASYNWSGPNSFISSQQNPSIAGATVSNAGVYSVVVTGANGCSSTATVSAVVNALPSASASSNSPVCENHVISLSASSGTTYAWSGPNSFSSALQNPSISNAALNNAGAYSVIVTDANSCSATATVNVTVNSLPVAAASVTDTLCEGSVLMLTANGGASYSWSGPNSFTSTQQNESISNATLMNSGTYTVTVTDANGCTATATAISVVIAQPVANAASNSPLCNGDVLQLTSGSAANFIWSGPNSFSSTQQNPSLSNANNLASGTYTVIVDNGNGCADTAATIVIVNTVDTSVTQSGATLTANLNAAMYQWIDCTSGQPIAGQTAQVFNAPQVGVYAVVVTDLGCSDTSSCHTVLSVDITDHSNAAVQVYPNPSNGSFTVSLPEGKSSLCVYDMTGQIVFMDNAVNGPSYNLNLGSSAGIYVLEIKTIAAVQRMRLIVQ